MPCHPLAGRENIKTGPMACLDRRSIVEMAPPRPQRGNSFSWLVDRFFFSLEGESGLGDAGQEGGIIAAGTVSSPATALRPGWAFRGSPRSAALRPSWLRPRVAG